MKKESLKSIYSVCVSFLSQYMGPETEKVSTPGPQSIWQTRPRLQKAPSLNLKTERETQYLSQAQDRETHITILSNMIIPIPPNYKRRV